MWHSFFCHIRSFSASNSWPINTSKTGQSGAWQFLTCNPYDDVINNMLTIDFHIHKAQMGITIILQSYLRQHTGFFTVKKITWYWTYRKIRMFYLKQNILHLEIQNCFTFHNIEVLHTFHIRGLNFENIRMFYILKKKLKWFRSWNIKIGYTGNIRLFYIPNISMFTSLNIRCWTLKIWKCFISWSIRIMYILRCQKYHTGNIRMFYFENIKDVLDLKISKCFRY